MSEEGRAIICAALAFARADRQLDYWQASYDDNPVASVAALRDNAETLRWHSLAALLAAVRRYEEARRG